MAPYGKTISEIQKNKKKQGKLNNSVLLLISAQQEFNPECGKLPAHNFKTSSESLRFCLETARLNKVPVIHVMTVCDPNSELFTVGGVTTKPIKYLEPKSDEKVVMKTTPNAFLKTDLKEKIDATGRKNLIIAGYSTHLSVDSTVRAAYELGYNVTVVSNACGDRDIPDGMRNIVTGNKLHQATLATLNDQYATVVGEMYDI
ncbi:isochorismatase family hydrolase [Neocallimastix lanati (nom. inval.)]|jgi:nicotinamidase-related amidase|uniref:Isochorismatase family hydrolase n=1 Tax=Neocallimastix californiae TaxID=1754190 RepID=A0A1Y2F8F6_9FUNG|nr:isochorismatase family hydrolase [Neocallimastix sp. JGI-2020a]ORY80153.1 isochorismatase family hydrolase [Neocallimastix californiae]|eukprot:ORY80153.1 isochorismatase family hydrolase [Neocallimastix californiae]